MAVLAIVHGVIVSYFFNAAWGVILAATAIALLLALVVNAVRRTAGDARAERRFNLLQLVLVSLWMSSAIAIWMTGTRSAWVVAITVPASLGDPHHLFGARRVESAAPRAGGLHGADDGLHHLRRL